MIYLDYAATTPVDPRVFDAMRQYFTDSFGNPSSVHRFGQDAEAVVDKAREMVAFVLNCRPEEIVFTSCGSESDNLALGGAALAVREETGADGIAVARAEHHAVSKTAEHLEAHHGFRIDWLPVDEAGQVTVESLAEMIGPFTALVSVMYANNEIGTINPISEIGEVCRSAGIPFHTDAVQAAAYLPINVNFLDVDLLSIGAHKFYGPKGLDKLQEAIQRGMPVILSNYSMAGMSTPITPAGTLAVLMAELLAGLAVSQVIKPGTPVILGILPA